jgi:hypothetical protein
LTFASHFSSFTITHIPHIFLPSSHYYVPLIPSPELIKW